MSFRDEIKKIIKKQEIDFQVLRAKEKKHGDYSLNIALEIGKKRSIDPMKIALEFKEEIEKKKMFDKVEVLPPGFINPF